MTRTTKDSSNEYYDNVLKGVYYQNGEDIAETQNYGNVYMMGFGSKGVGFYKVPAGTDKCDFGLVYLFHDGTESEFLGFER